MNGIRVCEKALLMLKGWWDMTRMFLLVMLASLSWAASAVTDTFTASGTWTAPAGVTSVTVEAWGGGGAGGGATGRPAKGGGGAGGQYAQKVVTVVPGNVYTIVVGAGGVGGTGTGGIGGDSTFAGTVVVAKGGAGGTGVANGVGGLGSVVGGVGDIVYAGGNGANSTVDTNCNTGGGGGGGAGSTGAGGNAVGNAGGTGTAVGGGAGGTATTGSGNGAAGTLAGGAGAGACAENNTDRSGGAGAAGQVTVSYTSSGPAAVTYYHDTTTGVVIGVDGPTNVQSNTNVIIPPIITASMITANTCTGNARSQNHPTGLYTHSRWYLTSDYAVATLIGANPTGSARLRGGAATDTVTVSLYDYDPISGAKTLIGSSAPITLTTFGATTNYPYTISSSAYTVPAGHRLMLQYDFNQASATSRARVYCDAVTPSYISVTESVATVTPVVEYRMDEASWNGTANEAADSTVNALHGAALLGATTATAKICNGANLVANYMEVPDNALLDISSTLTVTAWIKPARWGGVAGKDALMTVLSKDTNYELHIDSTGHVFWWWGTGSLTSTATVPIGSWTHVALVYANGSQTIYINGTASGTATFAGALPVNALPLQIGDDQGYGGGTRRFDGMIDEVKVFNGALTGTQISTGYANENAGKNWDGTVRTCPSYGPHHIEIQHDGNGLTCSADTVTIRACVDAAVPCNTLYTAGGLSVTLTPGGQTFAIDATGINSAASVQQSTTGSVTLSAVSVPAATDATPTTCWNTATSTASCAMTFSDSGFVVTAPDHVACNNVSVTIEAVETAPGTGRCVPAYQNVTRAVNLKCAYANPTAGTLPVNAAGVALNSTNDASAACDGTGRSPTLSFDGNGTATISLNYADAGQLTLIASDTAPTGKAMAGSDTFVVAPASFAFSGIPAAPLTAGQAFNATVTAMNACATPAATPNFTGQTVAITSSNPQPGLGNATAINTSLTATSGTGSANLTWDEVGTIDLNASLSNYLGSALSISGSQTGVGRFRPAYFDTAVSGLMACPAGLACPASNDVLNGFIYSGQPFTVKVIAKSLTGNATVNYQGATYAHDVTLTAWDALGSTVTQNPGGGALASNAVAAADFAAGVATLATPTYTFGTVQTAPTDIFIRAKESPGADNVTSLRTVPATSVEGGVTLASGRIKLSNGHGSELLPLPLAATVQYYNGTAWVRSDTDTVTALGASDVALAFPAGTASKPNNLAACETAVSITGISPAFAINLSAPGNGDDGWTNLTLNLGATAVGNRCTAVGGVGAPSTTANRPWLQFPAGTNPTARATFGVYRGNDEFIYLRENY